MTFEEVVKRTEDQAKSLVWWSPSQIARGDDLAGDPAKGERPWSVPRTTGVFLHGMVSERKPKTILELGTSIGYSTLWLAEAAKDYGGHVHTVEMKQEKCDIASENIRDAGLEKTVTFHHSKIMEFLEQVEGILLGEKIDLLFLDADRGHYHEYFPLIKNHLSAKAILVADNAENMQSRMIPFLELLAKEGWHCEIKNIDNGILVAKRTS